MGSTRRAFTPEYKEQSVAFVLDGGRPVAEVARNIGVHEMTLGKWVKVAREAAAAGISPDALLGESGSGYYAWRAAEPSQREKDDCALIAVMRQVHKLARGNPGVRRLRAGLAALGHVVSHKRVHRLMQAAGLRGRHPRAWKRTTIGGDRPVPAPDLIGRDFTAAHPGTRWCGDVTYIRTWDGWAYMATVIDLHSRKAIRSQ